MESKPKILIGIDPDTEKNGVAMKVNKQFLLYNFDILLSRLCFIYKDNNIIIDYRYFNYFIKIAGYKYKPNF